MSQTCSIHLVAVFLIWLFPALQTWWKCVPYSIIPSPRAKLRRSQPCKSHSCVYYTNLTAMSLGGVCTCTHTFERVSSAGHKAKSPHTEGLVLPLGYSPPPFILMFKVLFLNSMIASLMTSGDDQCPPLCLFCLSQSGWIRTIFVKLENFSRNQLFDGCRIQKTLIWVVLVLS